MENPVTIYRLIWIVAFVALAWPAAGQQQESGVPADADLKNRVEELERQIRELKEKLGAPEGDGSHENGTESGTSERLDELDQRLRIQRRQDELRREADAERLKTAPTLGAGREGFQLRSADGSFVLRLRGLVHSDGRFFADDSVDTAADTFVMRRVRPIVEATMFKNFDVRLMPDLSAAVVVEKSGSTAK